LTKGARWLDLIAFLLQHRFPVTREQIFEAVADYSEDLKRGGEPESIRRKFERDKDELRELGINIETMTLPDQAGDEPATGYRLRPGGFYLPYLELASRHPGPRSTLPPGYQGLRTLRISEGDLAILDRATKRLSARSDFPLASAAASVRRKLAFDLPLTIEHVERVLTGPAAPRAAQTLEALQTAVLERRRIRATYYSIGRDAEEDRELEPYGLFFNWGNWYCVAGGARYHGWRVFRVDRIHNIELLTNTFEPPLKFTVRGFLGRRPWQLAETQPEDVRVRFAFPESRWVMAQGAGQVIQPLTEDGGAVLAFEVHDRNPFLRWLLTFRQHAVVEDPPDVAREFARLRRAVARLYRNDPIDA
jgi:predicted DNA-binding transcriptional regulator YafY